MLYMSVSNCVVRAAWCEQPRACMHGPRSQEGFDTCGFAPPKRSQGESYRKEGDAQEKRHQKASLFGRLWDQQHPPRNRELACHLYRLPPKVRGLVVGG
eukprot:15646-Prymnesium_polylepis.3